MKVRTSKKLTNILHVCLLAINIISTLHGDVELGIRISCITIVAILLNSTMSSMIENKNWEPRLKRNKRK